MQPDIMAIATALVLSLHIALDWDMILKIKRGIFARNQGV